MKYTMLILFVDIERSEIDDMHLLHSFEGTSYVNLEHLRKHLPERIIPFTIQEFVNKYNSDSIQSFSSRISYVFVREI